MATIMETSQQHIQVKFFTKQSSHSVPDTPLSVPADLDTARLSDLINSLLTQDEGEAPQHEFDFLIDGEFLRTSLQEYMQLREISEETVLEVEYIETLPGPTPSDSVSHEDWVSAVHTRYSYALSGCYDKTIKIMDVEEEECYVTTSAHDAPVKCLRWITSDDPDWTFVTGSHDQTLRQWRWSRDSSTAECVHVCRGHAASVDCVAVNDQADMFCSGSWDKMLKIWSTEIRKESDEGGAEEIPSKKKTKLSIPTKTPLATLSGHSEAVSGCCWLDNRTVVTSSWDHTLRLWDLDTAQQTKQMTSSKAFLAVNLSPLCKLLATGSVDRHIRLYDPRVTDGEQVQLSLTSHTGWISGVCWSQERETLLLSASYDGLAKLWDTRSPKAPLYDLAGHEDKILCCDWSSGDHMMTGGADNELKHYRFQASQEP